MSHDDPLAHQLALALLLLAEAGDEDAVRLLVEGLTIEELRAVLIAQTGNVRQAFGPWFQAVGLAAVAARYGRAAAEGRHDYLRQRILRAAASA